MTALVQHPQALVTPRAGQTWLKRGQHETVRVVTVQDGLVGIDRRDGKPASWVKLGNFNRDFTRCT